MFYIIFLPFFVAFVAANDQPTHEYSLPNRESSKPTWPPSGIDPIDFVPLHRCIFRNNTCHFQNQHNMNKFKHFINDQKPIFNARSALILDLSNYEAKKYPGGRLITHYYPAVFSNACLKLTYRWLGKPQPTAQRKLNIIQQDTQNRCLYSEVDSLNYMKQDWKTIFLQLNVDPGEPRFFFEVVYNPRKTAPGEYFVLSEFLYAYGKCPQNNVNECRISEF